MCLLSSISHPTCWCICDCSIALLVEVVEFLFKPGRFIGIGIGLYVTDANNSRK